LVKSVTKEDAAKDDIHVEFNRDWCKGCAICVTFCPKQAIALDAHEKAFLAHPKKCNVCGVCELRCPDMAIEVKPVS
jgi:2-oxoglutarate ferredoxin oxidoreductase subunit delta